MQKQDQTALQSVSVQREGNGNRSMRMSEKHSRDQETDHNNRSESGGQTVRHHPSIDEQNEIVKFLDKKCSAIDDTIAKKKEQLEVLADYKKSLIYEYVTGKKEVLAHE